MRVRIEIDAGKREAEFIRHVPHPPISGRLEERIAEVLMKELVGAYQEASDWLERKPALDKLA